MKLFWTWVDRHNSISMSLLLLVAETTRVETTDKKERIWYKDLEQDWNELYEKFQNINTEPIESNLLVLIRECLLRHRSCISQQLKAFSKPAIKKHYIDALNVFKLQIWKQYLILCAIWNHLYNLKNVKNTHGRVLLLAVEL